MKILWITNIFFPEWYAAKGIEGRNTGGWMKSLADALVASDPDLEITVASPFEGVKEPEFLNVGRYRFVAIPRRRGINDYDPAQEADWLAVRDAVRPDLVHIHGSELPHGLAWVNACSGDRVVVSLQGIVSRVARYNSGYIKSKKFFTPYGVIKWLRPSSFGMDFNALGVYEEDLLSKVPHIIGRTSWDRAHAWAINPSALYHFCNENLRPQFSASDPWDVNSCSRHTIFLSQAASPIKGLHKLLEALPLILRHYPDTRVRVGGINPMEGHGPRWRRWLKSKVRSPYLSRLDTLLANPTVGGAVEFLGSIPADRMVAEYLSANVFVCPSSIENSPNSLGEAQMLGCPVVASYVGGIPDMVTDGETGLLYRFEEQEMLADAICRLFASDDLARRLSAGGRQAALKRHDSSLNAARMIEIYNRIASTQC